MILKRFDTWQFWLLAGSVIGITTWIWINADGLGLGNRRARPAEAVGIEAVPPEIEFHREEKSEQGTVQIILHNRSLRPVKLLEVSATCGCTLPNALPLQVLDAGQQVQLAVQVTPPSFGHKNSIVTIRSDSPITPTIQVPMRLYGRKLTPPYMRLAPSDIRVDTVAGAAPPAKIFQIICVESPGDPWLTGFKSSSSDILVKSLKVVNENQLDETTVMRDYDAELEFSTTTVGETNLSGWLTPVTRSESNKTFPRIGVTLSQVNAIRVAPSSVVLSFVDKQAEKITRHVVLLAADESEWDITSVKTDVSWLTTQISPRDPTVRNRKIIISATKPATGLTAHQQTDIRIYTSHPQCPEIVVRATGVWNSSPASLR